MADVVFSHTKRNWNKLQLSIYVEHPEPGLYWDLGETVLEETATTTPTLVSDGTGENVLSLSDSALDTLLDDSKPAGYDVGTDTLPAGAPIYVYSKKKWNSIIQAARSTRDEYQNAGTDPLDPING